MWGRRPAGGGTSRCTVTMEPPTGSNVCLETPPVTARRVSSSAENVLLQESISAAASRHTNIGITRGRPSGIGLDLLMLAPNDDDDGYCPRGRARYATDLGAPAPSG